MEKIIPDKQLRKLLEAIEEIAELINTIYDSAKKELEEKKSR